MKKYIFLLIVILFLVIGSGVNAESFFAEISGDKVLMRNTAADGSVELKSVAIYNLEDYKYFGIRAMAVSCGAEVSWDESTKTVIVTHNDLVISLKNNSSIIYINGNKYDFGYPVIIIDGKSYAPLELYKAFTGELQVVETADSPDVSRNSENKETIIVEHGDGADRIVFPGTASGLINDFTLVNPDRIVLDIKDITLSGIYENGMTYKKIRHFKGSDGITRIVFDLKADFKYNLNYEGNDVVITISANGLFEQVQELIEFRNNSIIINTSEYSGYAISRSTDPFAINVSIPGKLIANPFKIDVEGEFVTNISAASDGNSTNISIELKEQCAFELEKLKDAFVVGIYTPVIEGVIYHNTQDKHYISMDLLESIDSISSVHNKPGENLITVNDPDNTITSGQIYINDEKIKSVYITRNGNDAIIRIVTKDTVYIKAEIYDNKPSLVIFENDYSDLLVVISPGHGGSDPGAIANDIYEAHINLDISKKLRFELENAGVTVHMLRNDDTFVSLDDRTAIANELNADLFISIHCNSLNDPSFDGLMTLVHSGAVNYQKINGKTAGTIIHEEVIKATNATDRGVRDRDKIIVLKDTAMPAVEVECGFLTNQAELGKLLEDSYQWSIAKGTASGVLKVLDLMD